MRAQFGDLWQSIERWIAKRYENEIARANLLEKGASFMAYRTHEQAAGGRNNTRDEGGDEISTVTHVSGGGAGDTPVRGSLSSNSMEVVNVIHKMCSEGLEAIMGMYAGSEPNTPEDVTVPLLEGSVDSSACNGGAAAAADAGAAAAHDCKNVQAANLNVGAATAAAAVRGGAGADG